MFLAVSTLPTWVISWRRTIPSGDVRERLFLKSSFYFINELVVRGNTCLSTFAKRPNKIYENILREINCCFLPEFKLERHHLSRGLLPPPETNNPQYDARLAVVHEAFLPALQDLQRTMHFSRTLLRGKVLPMVFCYVFMYCRFISVTRCLSGLKFIIYTLKLTI